MSNSSTLRTTWEHQRLWSKVASSLKTGIARARTWILVLIVGTAIMETSAAQLAGHPNLSRPLAMTGAVLAAVAALMQTQTRGRERFQQWTRARATSEGLKEHVHRYLTRTGKYSADADAALVVERDRILKGVADLLPRAAAETPTAKELPAVQDLATYVGIRLEGQIKDYYLPKASENARRGSQWHTTQTALLYVSAAFGALAAFFPDGGLGAWVSVITTVAGSFGAHIEASRYDHLAMSYRTTASRLQSLRDEWNDGLSKKTLSPEEQSGFIDRCEQAISVENEAWMAGWVKDA